MSVYIPRGFITTCQAAELLYGLQNAELLAGSEARAKERDALNRQKVLSKPPPIRPITERCPDRVDHVQIPFTAAQEARLNELSEIEGRLQTGYVEACSEVRAALAEGEFQATLIASDGAEHAVEANRWKAHDGNASVASGRIGLNAMIEGPVFVREDEFRNWVPQATAPMDGRATPVIDAQSPHGPNRVETDAPTGAFKREDFMGPDRFDALKSWAQAKYEGKYPGRDQVLADHRDQFGAIAGISEKKAIRGLLANLRSPDEKRGGARTHRKARA